MENILVIAYQLQHICYNILSSDAFIAIDEHGVESMFRDVRHEHTGIPHPVAEFYRYNITNLQLISMRILKGSSLLG